MKNKEREKARKGMEMVERSGNCSLRGFWKENGLTPKEFFSQTSSIFFKAAATQILFLWTQVARQAFDPRKLLQNIDASVEKIDTHDQQCGPINVRPILQNRGMGIESRFGHKFPSGHFLLTNLIIPWQDFGPRGRRCANCECVGCGPVNWGDVRFDDWDFEIGKRMTQKSCIIGKIQMMFSKSSRSNYQHA